MGKKGSWFSAIKRVFAPTSRDKLGHGSDVRRTTKDKKKWGIGKRRHGEANSFIPLYREPSSIEKILGDAERENHTVRDLPSREHQRAPSFSSKERQSQLELPSRAEEKQTPLVTPPKVYQPHPANYSPRPNPNLHHVLAAIRIQTTYRGYSARRSYRALKGLVRLQGVMRGQSVKRQTMNAMKCMQMLVRVQSQIHSRRVQMMESQAQQRQSLQRNDRDQDSSLGKWGLSSTPRSEKDDDQEKEWDDSILAKEVIEARLQRKVEAVIKRERQLAYAYSHQLWKATPKTAHAALMEIRAGGYPWWWNWVERHVPTAAPAEGTPPRTGDAPTPTPAKAYTPGRTPTHLRTPKPENLESGQPKSLRSSPAPRSRPLRTPTGGGKPVTTEFSPRTPIRDDESLTSCPAFSVPNYMAPTESAKAKVRAQSNLSERSASTPKKRMTFGLGQSIGSIRWSKGSFFSGKDSDRSKVPAAAGHEPVHSVGNLSVDSTVSLPVTVGRKPFRFK